MAYRLKSRFERLRGRGMLTGDEVAKKIGVCATTVHEWGRAGLLKRHLYGTAICRAHRQCHCDQGRRVTEAGRLPSSPLHQPHKVQYEVFALSRARYGRAGTTAVS
jgi:hypothetical protein